MLGGSVKDENKMIKLNLEKRYKNMINYKTHSQKLRSHKLKFCLSNFSSSLNDSFISIASMILNHLFTKWAETLNWWSSLICVVTMKNNERKGISVQNC